MHLSRWQNTLQGDNSNLQLCLCQILVSYQGNGRGSRPLFFGAKFWDTKTYYQRTGSHFKTILREFWYHNPIYIEMVIGHCYCFYCQHWLQRNPSLKSFQPCSIQNARCSGDYTVMKTLLWISHSISALKSYTVEKCFKSWGTQQEQSTDQV